MKIPAVLLVGLLGASAFATVAPLQLRVLEQAGPAGRNLASSLNIAAFNLGNALGAWVGGVTIEHGPGLAALQIGRAHVCTPVTNAHLVCRLLTEKTKPTH